MHLSNANVAWRAPRLEPLLKKESGFGEVGQGRGSYPCRKTSKNDSLKPSQSGFSIVSFIAGRLLVYSVARTGMNCPCYGAAPDRSA